MHPQHKSDGCLGNRSKFIDGIIDLLAGSAGGIACVYVGQPMDTVKVKMQTFPQLYSGMVDCFKQTYLKDGFRKGLYAGTIPALVANVAENSVLFAGYGMCQKVVANALGVQHTTDLNALSNAVAGFLGAFFSTFTLCPTELVKCRLQAMRETVGPNSKELMIGPWSLTRQILHQEGVPGLFRGLTSTMAREMPGYFCFFGAYELCRTLAAPPGKTKEEIGALRTILCGGIAGSILWTVIFPTDVVKSRIQVAGSKDSMRKVMTLIIRQEGVGALYNGLFPSLVRTFPASGALFLAYEYTKKNLEMLLY